MYTQLRLLLENDTTLLWKIINMCVRNVPTAGASVALLKREMEGQPSRIFHCRNDLRFQHTERFRCTQHSTTSRSKNSAQKKKWDEKNSISVVYCVRAARPPRYAHDICWCSRPQGRILQFCLLRCMQRLGTCIHWTIFSHHQFLAVWLPQHTTKH